MKCWHYLCLFLCALISMSASAMEVNNELTMLVVPARYTVMQLAFDVKHSYPTMLVSYQSDVDDQKTVLHAWDGKQWVYISMKDYQEGRFFRRMPTRVIIVGNNETVPPELIDGPAWSTTVMRIPVMDTAGVVNALGAIYDFYPYQYEWFARRYKLDIINIDEAGGKTSWYDGTMIKKSKSDGRVTKVYIPPESRQKKGSQYVEQIKAVEVPDMILVQPRPEKTIEEIEISAQRMPDGSVYVDEFEAEETGAVMSPSGAIRPVQGEFILEEETIMDDDPQSRSVFNDEQY